MLSKSLSNSKIIKNCKVTHKDSVIYKLIHYNAKYNFLYTSFIVQNTLFNLTKKKAWHSFALNHLIQQWSNRVDKKLKGIFNYHSQIALI